MYYSLVEDYANIKRSSKDEDFKVELCLSGTSDHENDVSKSKSKANLGYAL